MKLKSSIPFLFICIASISFQAPAVISLAYYPTWSPVGGVAGICYFQLPDLKPLSVPRTLVVDNHLPNGSVLYSWSYSEFAPNFSSNCQPNGSHPTASSSGRYVI